MRTLGFNFGSWTFLAAFPRKVRLGVPYFIPNTTLGSFGAITQGSYITSTKKMHTMSRDDPSQNLKKKIAEMEKVRKQSNPRKKELFVEVPESKDFLDTATMPMILTVVGTALIAKLLMMYDDSKSQEMIEQKIKNAPPGQGTVRMLTREEWEEIQEVRPRTPFESKLARPISRIRTGESLGWEDLKDWTTDIFTDAFTRVEESVRRGSS